MTRPVAAFLAAAAVFTLGACSAELDQESPTAVDPAPSFDPIPPGATLDELLTEIETLLLNLDERIIEEHDHEIVMARIDDLWFVAEAQIRATDPDDVFAFEQPIMMARNGVDRRQAAEASKGYKIFVDVVDEYLDP